MSWSTWTIFKQINDRYGHQTGDKVLKSAASILSEAIRKTDILGRFGGGEFMILLPDTTLAAATEVAERCRCQLGEVRIAVDGKPRRARPEAPIGGVALLAKGVDHWRRSAPCRCTLQDHAENAWSYSEVP